MNIFRLKICMLVLMAVLVPAVLAGPVRAQNDPAAPVAQVGSTPDRLARKITLDARSMNVVDIIQFLAHKGDFNTIISPSVHGQSTVYLQDVPIKDALDIVTGINRLAYQIDRDVINVMSAPEYERLYGKVFNDQTIVSVVHLHYSKPAFVLAALDSVKSRLGKIVIDEDTGSVILMDTSPAVAAMKAAISQIEQPLDDTSYELKYARAAKVVEKLRPHIDAKGVGSISGDDRSNSVLARTFPGRRGEVERFIKSMDSPTRQVRIEARILQVILKPGFHSGIDWSALVRNSAGKTQLHLKSSLPNDNITDNFGQIGVGTIDASDFAAAVQDLRDVSDTKILSTPEITATNNEEAKIHVGDTVPYIITSTTGTGDAAFQSEEPRFVDVGLSLDVTPTISDDGMVTMKLHPQMSSIVARITSAEGGIPQVNTTDIETVVMVRDGTTVVMSGFRQDQKAHQKNDVPGLMDVPYLGALFSNTSDTITSTETVILITPHIIKLKGPPEIAGRIKPAKTYDATAAAPAHNPS